MSSVGLWSSCQTRTSIGIAHEFAHAAFFEGGRDENGLAGARYDESEEALAKSPANAGEVVERGAGAEEDGVEFGIELGHPFLRMEQAAVKFVGSDGVDAVAERFQHGEGGW